MVGLANASNTLEYIYTASNIDMNALGPVLLFTTFNSALKFAPKELYFITESFVGPLTSPTFINLGFNNPLYDNYTSGQGLGIIAGNDFDVYAASLIFNIPAPLIPGNTGFYINVVSASDAPTLIMKMVLKGIYTT